MGMVFPAGRDAFGDPRTGEVFPWGWNHKEEQSAARVRSLSHVQPTIGRWRPVPGMFMQSTRDDVLLKLAGQTRDRAQHEMFLRFLRISLAQTIYFHHWAGEIYVCQLIDYEPQEKFVRGIRNERYVWDYTMQIDTINS